MMVLLCSSTHLSVLGFVGGEQDTCHSHLCQGQGQEKSLIPFLAGQVGY